MTKVVSAILSGPIGLIDKKLGQQISGIGLTVIGIATGNPLLTAAGSFQLSQGFAPQAPKPEQTETALKAPISPRVSGYGANRLYMDYALYVAAADGTAVDVGSFHEGRVDSIIGYYLGDKKVSLTADGYVVGLEDGQFGKNNDNVLIGATLGPATNSAFPQVIAKVPSIWTTDHRGDGIVTGFAMWKAVKAKNFQEIYSGGGPNNMPLSLAMQLQPVFDWRDPSQSVADPLSWRWSENAILHLVHYQIVRRAVGPTRPPEDPAYWSDLGALYSARWASLFAPTVDYLTAAADDADVPMPLKAGGTEPRYRSCVVHKHTDEHQSVEAALLAACDGWMSPRADGALVVYSGRFQEPTVTIDGRDIISYSVQNGVIEEQAVNTIPLTYVSAPHEYSTVDTDAWVNEDDLERRGKELASSGLANQVPSHSQARRLGKRAYAEAMAPKRGTTTTRWTGRKILGQRYIRQKLDDLGLTITVQVKAPIKRDPITGQISFNWILADPNIDAWNPATEEGNPAPVGEVVAVEPLPTPTIISATAQYSAVGQTPEGDEPIDPSPSQTATGARILIAADGPDREDVTWSARWRVGTSGSWNEREYADADPGPGVSFLTEFVPLAANINVQVSYSVGDGRLSPWSASTVVNTSTG